MIDVMIITFNEELNLPHCLSALQGWTNNIFVIDSGSRDRTQEIAEAAGAQFIHHDWEGYAAQKNWGLRNLPFESDWILIIDADEVITDSVRKRLVAIASRPVNDVDENGFFINRLTYFMGQPIRHCGYFPSWNMRFFKRGQGLYEDREVHEHIVIENPVGYIRQAMIHYDRRGLEHYIAKHNRYSTLEARALFEEMTGAGKMDQSANVARDARLRRWLKRNIMPHAPFAGLWRFLYMYILQLGILDGRAGLEFCKFISMYDTLVAMKLRSLRRQAKEGGGVGPARQIQGLTVAEGMDPVVTEELRRAEEQRSRGAEEQRSDVRRSSVPPLFRSAARPLPASAPDPESPAHRFGNLVPDGRKVIITGGSGFIGTNLVDYYWKSGAEVINIDIAPPRNPEHAPLRVNINIEDREALRDLVHEFQPEIVHHLAARTDLREQNDLRGYSANMQGVESVLHALEGLPSVRRIVFTSTQLVCRPEYEPKHEIDYAPHTLYGMSKVVTEALIRGWRNAPCPWTIVRPTSIWGPWFDVPYKDFFTAIARRMYRHQRGFNALRSFGFVGNCVYEYVKLADAPEEDIHQRMFYMADFEPIRIRQWANMIQQEMDIKPLREVSYTTLKIAAKFGDVLQRMGVANPPMTSFRLRNLTSDNVNDLSPLEKVIGPLPYTVEEGVRLTVNWLRQHDDVKLPPAPQREAPAARDEPAEPVTASR